MTVPGFNESSQPVEAEQPVAGVPLTSAWEQKALYTVLTLTLVATMILLIFAARISHADYAGVMNLVEHGAGDGHRASSAGELTFAFLSARAWDAFALRGGALILSFLTVLTGALFVLKGVQSTYNLRLAGKGLRSTLETSSPGLVMITVGSVLFAITILSQSKFSTNIGPDASPEQPAGETEKAKQEMINAAPSKPPQP